MVHTQTYYTMAAKDTTKVGSFWKGFHIGLLLLAAASGFITAYTFGEVTYAYGDNCILFADLSFLDSDTAAPSTAGPNATSNATEEAELWRRRTNVTLDPEHTVWGRDGLCSFCQFTPVMSMIFGLIWATFFFMCGKGGAGYETDLLARPWRIVYPALVFAAVFSVVLSASTINLSSGLSQFCKDFQHHIDYKFYRCIPEINEFTRSFHRGTKMDAYTNGMLSVAFAYIGLIAWWAQVGFLLLRIICVVDFQIYLYKLTPVDEAQV